MLNRNVLAPSAPGPEEVRAQLEKVLASRLFIRSARLCRFLRFSVEESLSGNGGRLTEQVIGMEVFDRRSDYDPRIDPIVRVEARRLRAKLKAYYTSSARGDLIMIGLPKGAYLPFFKVRAMAAERFEEAILADESCAEAYAGLADAYSLLANYGVSGAWFLQDSVAPALL